MIRPIWTAWCDSAVEEGCLQWVAQSPDRGEVVREALAHGWKPGRTRGRFNGRWYCGEHAGEANA